MTDTNLILYDRSPETYRHWSLAVDGAIATLTLNVDEEGGLQPGYTLKLNSYDLGVDMELADAVQRIRFEHPQVRVVILTSALDRVFCAGANIPMLGLSDHGWKVNFCKFTNETRNGLEDASQNSDLTFLAAVNGVCAGGGYEMALACDEIWLVDDRASAVSLPEVPLLGVLPGTGGLTRITDKRKVRRDLADVFCVSEEGVRGARARDWGLVDEVVPTSRFRAAIAARATELATSDTSPGAGEGISLTPLDRTIREDGYSYPHLDITIDEALGTATFTITGPDTPPPSDAQTARDQGAAFWPLAMIRAMDDAILMLRTNHQTTGLWLFKTRGSPEQVLAYDQLLITSADHWFLREVTGMLRRTFQRLDVSSRSLYAVIEEGSCFAGTLMELALAADRSFMLDMLGEEGEPTIALSALNFSPLVMVNGRTRLATRFAQEKAPVDLDQRQGELISPHSALEAGLVTFTPDELDWEDELRIAIEERVAMSPDALTGMEASLRFGGAETMATRIFGRLTAWQNWIFIRPNATGEKGALKRYGTGTKAEFDRRRV